MRFQKTFCLTFLLLTLCCGTLSLRASHIRAGDITAIRTGALTYCFRVTLYTEEGATADSPFLDLDFGYGTGNTGRIVRCGDKKKLGNGIEVGYYGFEAGCALCHTFPGPSANGYRVTFVEQNRQGQIDNMSNSVSTPFSISVLILINPSLGANTSPLLTVAPIDIACVGQKFFHNPGAYDVDGDSLVFKMAVPMQSPTQPVEGYRAPESFGGAREDGSTPVSFTLDSRTGDLVWDSPIIFRSGVYNVAFIVEEWRNGARIGIITRDMQIIVKNCRNIRPRLQVPDICVIADDDNSTVSNIISQEITASDGDSPPDRVKITSEQRQMVYDNSIFQTTASFPPNPSFKNSPATEMFNWATKAEHVRRQPYIVTFKAEDEPTPPRTGILIDIQSMLITVKGTPVKNVVANPNNRKMNLSWGDYKTLCPTFTTAQFDKMEYVIWRREGCGVTFPCNKNPQDLGYTSIGTVKLSVGTTFTDNGPLRVGLSYSYVITVKYPEPQGGVSHPSVEACAFVPIETPIITKVSVLSTNTTANNGEVEINWLRPKPTVDLTAFTTEFAPPYKYELYRAEGLSSNAFTLINTQTDATGNTLNFNFTDTGLDTKTKTYLYKVAWYKGVGTTGEGRMIDSDSSSTVRLTTAQGLNNIVLTWDYNTNWSNQNYIHDIYRGESTQPKSAYIKIGEQLVGQRKFIDNGTFGNICLDPNKIYGYYVKTKGSYNNTAQIPEPTELLRNDSQQSFNTPIDRTPPAPPILAIDTVKCPPKPECHTPIETFPLKNKLTWQPVGSGNSCQDFIATYRLYFKPAGKTEFARIMPPTFPEPYLLLAYDHIDLPQIRPNVFSQAGCYYITAVDPQGNESAQSNIVCQDNCLYFKLPNVFTPNADNTNDTFKACPMPQFVETVNFSVYNRWGGLVYKAETSVDVDWNGKNNQGQDLPAGTYYYEAKVKFVTIDESKEVQIFKGWVNLIR